MPQRSHSKHLAFGFACFVYPTAQFVVNAQQKSYFFLLMVDFEAIYCFGIPFS